mgnify:FL=1
MDPTDNPLSLFVQIVMRVVFGARKVGVDRTLSNERHGGKQELNHCAHKGSDAKECDSVKMRIPLYFCVHDEATCLGRKGRRMRCIKDEKDIAKLCLDGIAELYVVLRIGQRKGSAQSHNEDVTFAGDFMRSNARFHSKMVAQEPTACGESS